MNDKTQQKNQQEQKPKEQTFTLTEFNKKLAEELARQPRVSYSIAHGYSNSGRCPKLEIRVEGGDPVKSHALMVSIEGLLLDYAKNNPPQEHETLPTPPHYLPAVLQRYTQEQ
jgi:hypothetical protein